MKDLTTASQHFRDWFHDPVAPIVLYDYFVLEDFCTTVVWILCTVKVYSCT